MSAGLEDRFRMAARAYFIYGIVYLVGGFWIWLHDVGRVAELTSRARDQSWTDRSRSESSGDRVLQRSTTRGSFQGTPCSSGAAGSYSSATR